MLRFAKLHQRSRSFTTGNGSQYFPVNPVVDLEKIALLAEHRSQEREDARTHQAHYESALAALKLVSCTEKKIHLTLNMSPDAKILEQIRTNPAIISIECVDLSSDDIEAIADAVLQNEMIAALSLKTCIVSSDAKNHLSAILRSRVMQKFCLEYCQLDEWDILWLGGLLQSLFAVSTLAIIDHFSDEQYRNILTQLPITNLRNLAFNPKNLGLITEKLTSSRHIEGLELVVTEPMTTEQVEALFQLVDAIKLKKLSILRFKMDNEFTYKKFILLLRNNEQLQSLHIGHTPGIENDIFALLTMQNSTLSCVTIEPGTHGTDAGKLERIQTLAYRNMRLNEAREFIKNFAPEEKEEAEADIEFLTHDVRYFINALIQVSEVDYISVCQDEIKSMIKQLEAFQERLSPLGTTLRQKT